MSAANITPPKHKSVKIGLEFDVRQKPSMQREIKVHQRGTASRSPDPCSVLESAIMVSLFFEGVPLVGVCVKGSQTKNHHVGGSNLKTDSHNWGGPLGLFV